VRLRRNGSTGRQVGLPIVAARRHVIGKRQHSSLRLVMSMVLHTFEMFSALLSTCQVDKSAKNADDGSTSRPAYE